MDTSNNEHDLHSDVHSTVDNYNGDDLGSKEPQTLTHLIMLGVLLLATLATIVAGYFHGNMHLITTLKNAHG